MTQPTYVALDLETTGLLPERDAIIEVGMVKFAGRRVLDTFSSLVNPGRRIPFQITQLTGITEADLRDAPPLRALLPQIRQFIGDSILVGHSVEFDLAFLAHAGLRLSNRFVDTFALASIVLPHAARYNLSTLAEAMGVPLKNAHRALDDAHGARELFLALCERAGELPLPIVQEINRVTHGSRWPLAGLFRSFERQQARAAFTGSIGAQLQAKGIVAEDGQFGLLVDIGVDEEELTPAPEKASTDIEAMVNLLRPGGLVAQQFPGYEHRPQQLAMLEAVAKAMRDGEVLLVEAGTGTGKSLAYLIPAVHFAVAHGKRVVISTNTINLQDQLYQKDIPDLQRVLPVEFRAALLKGRSNYLCLRKLRAQQEAGEPLSPLETQTLVRIMVWAQTTTTGDCAELFLPTPADRAFWARVAADSASCLREECRYYRQGKCFLHRARRRAEAAHLVVVNHALLLADVATENAVLPEYQYLIVDEAHHLEEATTKQLSFEISQDTIDQELSMLSGAYRGRQGGLCGRIATLVSAHVPPAERREFELLPIEIAQDAADIGREFQGFLDELAVFASEQEGATSEYGLRVRITDSLRKQPAWSKIEIIWDNLGARLAEFIGKLEHLRERLGDLDEALPEAMEMARDLSARIEFWQQARAEISAIIGTTRANRVDWLEEDALSERVSLHSAPLHVGELINQYLLRQHESVIMTSATLRAGDDFSYLRGRLGVYEARELAVGSPFDYQASTLVYCPTDIPEPATPHYQQHVARAIDQVVRALHGRTLVLFTSYRQLRMTAEQIGPGLVSEGITVLEQGNGPSRAQLLQQFRDERAAVLFGTRSFWEGIDVMGPALSCVIIVRIPFSVPSEPIFAARAEMFDDPFNEYAVPEAVLRFRQGFGRLIRSKTDRGVVVVLDSRIFSKHYGQIFLRALPACTVERGTVEAMGRRVAQWIDG